MSEIFSSEYVLCRSIVGPINPHVAWLFKAPRRGDLGEWLIVSFALWRATASSHLAGGILNCFDGVVEGSFTLCYVGALACFFN